MDVIPIIPLQLISLPKNRASLFYLIKLIRLYKGYILFNVPKLLKVIKNINKVQQEQRMQMHSTEECVKQNHDHVKIEQLLMIQFALKIFKLVFVIFNFTYLVSMFFYIYMRGIEDFYYDVDYQSLDFSQTQIQDRYGRNFITYY